MEVGIVLELLSKTCLVDKDGGQLRCAYRGKLFEKKEDVKSPVVPGDRVYFSRTAAGEGVVEEVASRRNKLSRPASFYRHIEHVMVANVDWIAIISSTKKPPFRPGLVDRILVAATREDIPAVICLNKIDLMEEKEYASFLSPFEDLEYPVFFTSAVTGEGIESFNAALAGKVTVFVGHSGVGKSTILNALNPALNLRINGVSRSTGRGKHTTASARLHPIAERTFVVDTPGVREFGLWEITREDLDFYYPGISLFTGNCRFSRCTHTHEPGCGVKTALEQGKIPKKRYEGYVRILESLEP